MLTATIEIGVCLDLGGVFFSLVPLLLVRNNHKQNLALNIFALKSFALKRTAFQAPSHSQLVCILLALGTYTHTNTPILFDSVPGSLHAFLSLKCLSYHIYWILLYIELYCHVCLHFTLGSSWSFASASCFRKPMLM